MAEYTVEVRRRIAADPRRAYDAWLTPADWDQWFTHGSQIDARVGGKYSNGDHDTGTYLELVTPSGGAETPVCDFEQSEMADKSVCPTGIIRFTWDNPTACPGSEVEITFAPVVSGTDDEWGEPSGPPTVRGSEDPRHPSEGPRHYTDVTLRHTKLPQPETGRGEMVDGWGWALDNLAAYLEGGEKLDHDEWVRRKYGEDDAGVGPA